MIPQANIVLLTHGYLESLFLRQVLDRLLLKAEAFEFRWFNRDVIIDEAHNFGPTEEAVLTREHITHALEVAPFPVVATLHQALGLPTGQIARCVARGTNISGTPGQLLGEWGAGFAPTQSVAS
jgi:hypothetical protein